MLRRKVDRGSMTRWWAVGLAVISAVVVGLVVLNRDSTSSSSSNPAVPGLDLDFMSFGHDVYDFTPGAQKTINGVTLRLTDTGDFQAVEGDKVRWHTDTNAACAVDCRVVLQDDGNLVLQTPQGVLWSSGTSSAPGATMIFQPRDPYLTIRDAAYEVIWTSNGDNATGATAMLNGSLTGPRAVSVQSFLDSLAVNTHMDQYEGDAAKVYDKLNYLGVRTVRDHYAEDGSLLANYRYLAERGVRFDMLHYSSDFTILVRDAETMKDMPNKALVAVEGPNEINNFPFSCNGSSWQGGWPNNNGPAAQCFMENYYSRIKANAALHGVDVYNLTGNTSVVDPDKYGLLALAGQADLGNIHPYPDPMEQPRDVLLRALGSDYLTVPPSKAVITETGYQTSQVSQRAQALYYMNLYLDAFQAGFRKTYVYELTDNASEKYGFFDTNDRPKASATALHNLTSVLADTGAPREGILSYSISGMPKDAYSLAMQRSTGVVNLVLWDERPIWTGSESTPPPAPVTVNLGRPFSRVSVYNPMQGMTAVRSLSDVSSVDLALAGEPVVLELTP